MALLAEYLDSGGVAGEWLRRMLIEPEIPYNKHYNNDDTNNRKKAHATLLRNRPLSEVVSCDERADEHRRTSKKASLTPGVWSMSYGSHNDSHSCS